MNALNSIKKNWISIIVWGALWGIFEATVGYILHLLPISIGWLIWYPVACFFMGCVYRKTNSISAVLLTGTLSACIKLLNLLLPIRIDKVINPAFSIFFESATLAAVIYIYKLLDDRKLYKILSVIVMNTSWRLLYIIYLYLAPQWIRAISVLTTSEKFITFFIYQNIASSIVIITAYYFGHQFYGRIKHWEQNILSISLFKNRAVTISISLSLLLTNIILEMLL